MGKLAFLHTFHLLFFTIFLSIHGSDQLQSSQVMALLKIQKLLNYPSILSSWNKTTDFCNTEPNTSLTLVCYENNITQLHISGENGFPQYFSTDSFFISLSSLPSLKVLSLVSLGLSGPLPSSIGSLISLEILNISSNYFNKKIPFELSYLRNLQTLVLDQNMFTGLVPDWVFQLPSLAVLSLKNNSLSGCLPNSVSNSENLRILSLSMNQFDGNVPDLSKLTNLQVLDLEDNKFGPHFPVLHTKLITLILRKNRFRLGLPDQELSSFNQLQKLDISLNEFVGPFFPPLLSLPWLNYLDVSENRFTGMLFKNMSCNSQLGFFANLSVNYLTGDVPTCLKSEDRVVICFGNCLAKTKSEEQQYPYSYCRNEALAVKIAPNKQDERRIGKGVLASSLVGGVLGGVSVCGVVVFLITKRVSLKQRIKTTGTKLILDKVSPAYTLKLLSDARYISETMKLGALGLPPYRSFVLDELKEATSNFCASNFLGEGSHGQVYKGKLTYGTQVAIRSLKMRKKHSIQSYTHQIEQISKLRHSHLVSAIGHCFECYPDDDSYASSIFLIFEFVPNGTLRSCISEGLTGKKLSWTQRIAAAIGIARGIQFLHTGIVPGVYSNNLRITDALVDQNLHVKISSYNLPLLPKMNRRRRSVSAEVAYVEPKENVQSRAAREEKNDVYDMGVILLELIVGRPIISENDTNVAKDLLRVSLSAEDDVARRSIVDPVIHKECTEESLKTLMEVCVKCLSNEPSKRPSVEDVLWNLQFATQVQDSWRVDSRNNQGSPIMSPV